MSSDLVQRKTHLLHGLLTAPWFFFESKEDAPLLRIPRPDVGMVEVGECLCVVECERLLSPLDVRGLLRPSFR